MSIQLKSDGHGKYSETIKRSFKEFEGQYNSHYSQESLEALKSAKNNFVPVISNIEKIVVNREVKEFSQRLLTELDRLISIQEKSSIQINEEIDHSASAKS